MLADGVGGNGSTDPSFEAAFAEHVNSKIGVRTTMLFT
jgi:hypothetical protein